MKPVLSICIPTANRRDILEKNIRSILIQQPYIEGKVEIVVSDNSDNNDTCELVEELQDQYGGIKYYKNDRNIGALNYCIAMTRGTGVYRKLSNDTILFNHRSLADMVYTIESCQKEKPVIIWKIYHRIGKEYVSTDNFEQIMRTLSYYSTWISSYGLWEDEVEEAYEHAQRAKEEHQNRFKNRNAMDIVAQRPLPLADNGADSFWHLRYLRKSFEKRGRAIIVDSASNWAGIQPAKKYEKGMMKWFFYDYYLDIMSEFEREGYISRQCVEDLERDLVFSFFINYLVDFEFPSSNIEYDPDDTFIQDILNEYKDKEYFDQLKEYYELRRQQRIEELRSWDPK